MSFGAGEHEHSHFFSSLSPSLSPTFCQNGHSTGHIFYRLQIQDLPGESGASNTPVILADNKQIQSMGIPNIPGSESVTVMHQPLMGTPEILKRGELRQMKLMSLRSSCEVQRYLSSTEKCGDENNCPRMMQVGLGGWKGWNGWSGWKG